MKTSILFVLSNPLEDEPVGVDEELRGIEDAVRESERRVHIELHPLLAPRSGDLQQANYLHKPHIVHFSGHGSRTKGFLIKNAKGDATSIGHAQLARLMRGFGLDRARCVILNYCDSEESARAIIEEPSSGILCAIGTTAALRDEDAMTFARAFYAALGYGKSIGRAFSDARMEVALGKGQEEIVRLYVRGASGSEDTLAAADRILLVPPPEEDQASEARSIWKREDLGVVNQLGKDEELIVVFHAPWSEISTRFHPVAEKLAWELPGRAAVARVEETDENADALWEIGVRKFPAIALYRGGKRLAMVTGARPMQEILDALLPYLRT